MSWYYNYRPYVPVAQRRARAAKFAAKLAKKEKRTLAPVELAGRIIASSFWGKAWCENLESYSDFENRLPRGRTYVRNGSVIDLQIERGKVKAIVSGSEIYQVSITIKTLPASAWSRVKKDCARSIDSLIDLLQARFDQGIMQRLTQRAGGLFPQPKEIQMKCSCPDWAGMCKHVAATLYAVGARLDAAPELLFTLRNVDHLDLIGHAVNADNLDQALQGQSGASLQGADLGEVFGIELDAGGVKNKTAPKSRAATKPASRKAKPVAPQNLVAASAKRLVKSPPKKASKTKSRSTIAASS
jgi:uncharacterized Zn finger protein